MSGAARYQAYMLRLWAVGQGAGCDWRVSLENAHTGEKATFVDLESCCQRLQTLTGHGPDTGERSLVGTTKQGRDERAIGGVAILYFQWVIIVLLLAALLISLCEPAWRAHHPHAPPRPPPTVGRRDDVAG